MPFSRIALLIVSLSLLSFPAGARDGAAIWDSRCEECHGDPAAFSTKYLWNVDGQLQGQHHADNMIQFLSKHYVPGHELVTIQEMLLSQANTPGRFAAECSECHGEIKTFVEKSLWVGKTSISGMESGTDVGEFLETHRELQPEDAIFYQKLFFRIAGKSTPSRLFSSEPGLQFR